MTKKEFISVLSPDIKANIPRYEKYKTNEALDLQPMNAFNCTKLKGYCITPYCPFIIESIYRTGCITSIHKISSNLFYDLAHGKRLSRKLIKKHLI